MRKNTLVMISHFGNGLAFPNHLFAFRPVQKNHSELVNLIGVLNYLLKLLVRLLLYSGPDGLYQGNHDA